VAQERIEDIGGLITTIVVPASEVQTAVVLLHGYAMNAADLASFAHALGGNTMYLLPQASIPTPMGGYGWWDVNLESRSEALLRGPRDLINECPPGLPQARVSLLRFLEEVKARFTPRRIVLGGFSQGGMLACDFVLHEGAHELAGLFLLSSSRINFDAWHSRQTQLARLPVLISHGKADDDLSLAAGQALRDFARGAGADVTWIEFEEGHQIPLPVWRELRRFIRKLERH